MDNQTYNHHEWVNLYIVRAISCFLTFTGCKKEANHEPLFGKIEDVWVDKESSALQFIDFYADNEARFGLYSKNFVSYQ